MNIHEPTNHGFTQWDQRIHDPNWYFWRVYPVRSKNPWPKLVFLDGFGLADEQPLVGPTHPLQDKHRESIGIQFNFQQSLANWLGYGGLKLSLHIFTIFWVHVQGPTSPAEKCDQQHFLRSLNPHPIRESHPILCMAQLFLQQISRFSGCWGRWDLRNPWDPWDPRPQESSVLVLKWRSWEWQRRHSQRRLRRPHLGLRGEHGPVTWRDLEWWISDGANECKSMKNVRCKFYEYRYTLYVI